MGGLAIYRLHEQQFQIIGRAEILWHSTLCHYQDLACALGGEDLSSVMEDNRWLAVTGPGMLASREGDQVIFPFQALFHQAHVILFFEWPQRQDCAEDGCCFDTNEHCRMHTAS